MLPLTDTQRSVTDAQLLPYRHSETPLDRCFLTLTDRHSDAPTDRRSTLPQTTLGAPTAPTDDAPSRRPVTDT